MLSLFKKKQPHSKLVFSIDGMHCTSCSMNIDGELEEVRGVHSASTSYAKSKTTVSYDSSVVSKEEIRDVIEQLGYSVGEAK